MGGCEIRRAAEDGPIERALSILWRCESCPHEPLGWKGCKLVGEVRPIFSGTSVVLYTRGRHEGRRGEGLTHSQGCWAGGPQQ